MVLPMTQRGAWWKGITDDGIEVAVSHSYMKRVLDGCKATGLDFNTQPVADPQHWVNTGDSYTGWKEHGEMSVTIKYIGGRPYATILLGTVDWLANGNYVGRDGTIVLRQLSVKQLEQWDKYYRMIADMRAYVEDFWSERGVTVDLG